MRGECKAWAVGRRCLFCFSSIVSLRFVVLSSLIIMRLSGHLFSVSPSVSVCSLLLSVRIPPNTHLSLSPSLSSSIFLKVTPPLPLPSLASYYSERLMGTARVVPGGNYRGYEESSLLLQAASLKNRSLLLVHGTADTDVHFDHTLKLSRALTKAGVIFRWGSYRWGVSRATWERENKKERRGW